MIPEEPTEAQVKALLAELPERTKAAELRAVIQQATVMIRKAEAGLGVAVAAMNAAYLLEKVLDDPGIPK